MRLLLVLTIDALTAYAMAPDCAAQARSVSPLAFPFYFSATCARACVHTRSSGSLRKK
jgi:hypothetical protein